MVHRVKVVVRVVLEEEDLLVTRWGCVKGEIEGRPGVVVVDRLQDKEVGVGHHKGEGHRVAVIHEGHHLVRDEELHRVVGETREAHHRIVVDVEIGGHHLATQSASLEFQWLGGRTTDVGLTMVAVDHLSDGRRAAMEWEDRQGIQINCHGLQTPKR